MKKNDYIQVLWVEDDPKVINEFPLKAEYFDIELVPYACWDDAKKALEEDFDRWSAIILDAKCKYHRDSSDNAIVFLRESLKDITVISGQKGRLVPWYILSGGAENDISDSISDERLKWDSDWKEKKFYSKNTDTSILFHRIKVHAQKSSRLQIQEMYRNVFEAIEFCNIDDEAYNALEDLLLPIHFPNETREKDYNDKFKKVRIFLEYVFRSMINYGILPDWGNEINLRWSSQILAGNNATKKDDTVVVESKKRVIPVALAQIMKSMTSILPADVHSKSTDEEKVNIPDYLNSVDNSTYLLKSFALQLCDLVIWYKNYLIKHPDEEINALEWNIVRE